MARNAYYKNIEWEMLQNPLNFNVKEDYKLSDNNIDIYEVNFKRNGEYDIIGEFNGTIPKEKIKYLEEFFDSKFNKEYSIESDDEIITFNYKRTISIERLAYNFTITFYVTHLEKRFVTQNQVAWICDWYLNGSRLRFNRITTYIKNEQYQKKRNINFKTIIDQDLNFPENVQKTVKNFLYVEPKNTQPFIISQTPNEFIPKWSRNMSVEYYEEFGFPSDEDKQKISEILSFIFGRYLIKIGESVFDKNGYPICEKSISPDIPYTINIKTICKDYDYTPINYNDSAKDKYQIEKDLSLLIDEYVLATVDYHNVFDYLRNSILLPRSSEIVLLAGALDYLIKELRKKYDINDEYMSESEFKRLVGNELEIINDKLGSYPKLLNNLNNSYKKKGTSNFDEVFERLNLEIGEIEEKAISYRHIPAHGQKMKQKTKEKFPILVDVYRVLLNRCILKSLNYENDYFDVISHCNRPINEAIPKENFVKILEYLNIK